MEENQELLNHNNIVHPQPLVEEKITFSRLECIFAYVMLAVGFCFIRFVFWNVTGILTTIFFMGTAFACLFYLHKNNYKLNNRNKIQLGIILLFSLVFSITANYFVKFLDVLFLLMLGTYWVYSICIQNKKIERFFFFDMLKALIIIPFSGFGKAFMAITYSAKKSKSGNNVKLILIGLVATIPFTMVIASLLTSADRGVEEMLNALFGNFAEGSYTSIIQFTLGIPVAFYIFGMLYSNVKKVKQEVLTNEQCESTLEKIKTFPNVVVYSALTPITILYVMFFVSQLRYFISAFNGILPEDYSYAEYARRGFFELFVIAILNLIILLIINFLSKETGEKKPALLKIYSVILSVFTILIIATALSKMGMYISNYGFTQLRVYASWLMVLLTTVFVLIIIKQFKPKFCFERYTVMIFVFLFGILCFSNVDGNIAKFNIKMYEAGYLNNLDVETLCDLSDDALVCVLKEGIDTQNYLDGKLESYNYYPYNTYNLSSYRVKKLLEDR